MRFSTENTHRVTVLWTDLVSGGRVWFVPGMSRSAGGRLQWAAFVFKAHKWLWNVIKLHTTFIVLQKLIFSPVKKLWHCPAAACANGKHSKSISVV